MPCSPAAEPPDADAAFRIEVGRLRARAQRRRFPAELHLGVPGGHRVTLELPAADAGLRLDLLSALLDLWRAERGGPAFGWVVRPGVPTLHDDDLAWYAAAVRAFGALGESPEGFRAVTRTGWLDVVTGESRVWKRLRLARSG
ncbi:MAG TPA: hypothetical protein VFG72_09370 [Marmoricola sp.]|nr:hypothetical protein [Marmoricola sp.]